MYNSYILNSIFMDKENYIDYEKYKELSKQKVKEQVSKQLVDKEQIKKRNENILLNFLKSPKQKESEVKT